jgi:magnesium chelatase accessory protein
MQVGNLHWHYQISRHQNQLAPSILLIHGTGSSAHTWQVIFEHLRKTYTVIAPDLPGHGFTQGATKQQLHIDQMAVELKQLLEKLEIWVPDTIVGHSAGANCGFTLAAISEHHPQVLIGLNPSFVSPPAAYHYFMAPLINPIATSSFLASFLSQTLGLTKMIDKLLDSTNSILTESQRVHYRYLFQQPSHIHGSMNFMAASDIPTLLSKSSALQSAIHFLMTEDDPWIPLANLKPVIEEYFPEAELLIQKGGHLFHEIYPTETSKLITQATAAVIKSATQNQ